MVDRVIQKLFQLAVKCGVVEFLDQESMVDRVIQKLFQLSCPLCIHPQYAV